LPWNCNLALKHAITKVQVNQDGLKLQVNGTHQLLIYVVDVNLSAKAYTL